jgi:hypothetical protein
MTIKYTQFGVLLEGKRNENENEKLYSDTFALVPDSKIYQVRN